LVNGGYWYLGINNIQRPDELSTKVTEQHPVATDSISAELQQAEI
jgi:hypothetical protein